MTDNQEPEDEREDDKLDMMKHDEDERGNDVNRCPNCGCQMTACYDSFEGGVIGRQCDYCGHQEGDV